MNNLEDNDTLTQRIIGCAIEVHRTLGPGLLESAYEQCMAHEMTLQDIAAVAEMRIGRGRRGVRHPRGRDDTGGALRRLGHLEQRRHRRAVAAAGAAEQGRSNGCGENGKRTHECLLDWTAVELRKAM